MTLRFKDLHRSFLKGDPPQKRGAAESGAKSNLHKKEGEGGVKYHKILLICSSYI